MNISDEEWRTWAGGIWTIRHVSDDKDMPFVVYFQGHRQARFRCETDATKFVAERVARAKGALA